MRHDAAGPAASGPVPASRLATVFFTVTGNLALVVLTLVLGLIASVLGWLPPRGRIMYRLSYWWSRGLLWASGVRLETHFAVPLEPRQGYVFMANHQSLYDIPVMLASLPGETRFLAKRSLFRLPVFGWALHAGGFIPVDRGDRDRSRDTFAAAIRCLASGRSILLFPEETRSTDGELLPFKRGGLLLARKTGFPIVPVGIRGTLGVRSRDSWQVHPGRVQVRYGEPIHAADYGLAERERLANDVRESIARLMR